MTEVKVLEMVTVLEAIDNGWNLVDERINDDFMIFINESRERLENFRPKKEMISEMQYQGYLYPLESLPRHQSIHLIKKSDDKKWREVTESSPIVYFFTITPKGDKLLNLWVKQFDKKEKRRIGFI